MVHGKKDFVETILIKNHVKKYEIIFMIYMAIYMYYLCVSEYLIDTFIGLYTYR